MKRTAAALAVMTALSPVASAVELPKFEIPRLGIFRKKKEDPPATPPQQPPAMQQPQADSAKPTKGTPAVDVLKTDLDEKKRLVAAEALRSADPRTSPDVMPALMTSLQQDPSANVRAAVAETIGKLKPVSREAGSILELSVVGDPAEAVRKASQQALWQYHLNGYRSSAANAATPQTAEPPLAKPKAIPAKPPIPAVLTSKTPAAPQVTQPTPPVARPITTGIGKGAIYPQTIEPPLAKPKVEAIPDVKPEPKFEVKPPLPSINVPPISIPTPMPPMETSVIPLPPAAPSIPTIPPPAK